MSRSNKKTVFLLQVDRKHSGKLEAFGYCDSKIPEDALKEIKSLANNLIEEELFKYGTDECTEVIPDATSQRDRDSGREAHIAEVHDLR